MPAADGKHRRVVGLAFHCQERAKRKLSTPSRGRAGMRNKRNSLKDSSTSKGSERANIGSPGKSLS